MLNDYEIEQKKNRLVLAIAQLVASLLVLYGALQFVPMFVDHVQAAQTQSNEQLKIRVIANSSSKQDQQTKAHVVENIQSFIRNNDEKLEDIHSFNRIYQHIQKNHANLKVTMKTEDNLFPPKIHYSQFYPQGHYYSVVFVIGAGRGENWFCAVFPTLCSPPKGSENEKPPSFLFEWWQKKKQKDYTQSPL